MLTKIKTVTKSKLVCKIGPDATVGLILNLCKIDGANVPIMVDISIDNISAINIVKLTINTFVFNPRIGIIDPIIPVIMPKNNPILASYNMMLNKFLYSNLCKDMSSIIIVADCNPILPPIADITGTKANRNGISINNVSKLYIRKADNNEEIKDTLSHGSLILMFCKKFIFCL